MKRLHFIKKKSETKPTFEVTKETDKTKFDPTINYFNEYWNVYYENEFILAKIKETAYEINVMKSHINEIEQKKNCIN